MNTDKILQEIIFYYNNNRRIGNTFAVFNGIKNLDKKSILIVANNCQKTEMKRVFNSGTNILLFTFDDIECDKLRGIQGLPLVFDNFALQVLFQNILYNNEKIKNELVDFKNYIDEYFTRTV